jgi:ElaB/YqjD/DUF883 family membrane-anchored ribosome-binding protein
MSAPVKNMTDDRGSASGRDLTLAELRKSVNAIAKELAEIAEERGRAVRDTAEAGTAALRSNIRRQPVLALGVAALAGALLAVLLVPRSTPARSASRWAAWAPPVTRADLYEVTDSIQRSMARAAGAVPLTATLERLAQAVAKVDPNASFDTMLDKFGGWMKRMRSPGS